MVSKPDSNGSGRQHGAVMQLRSRPVWRDHECVPRSKCYLDHLSFRHSWSPEIRIVAVAVGVRIVAE